jgi:hypothetical protein
MNTTVISVRSAFQREQRHLKITNPFWQSIGYILSTIHVLCLLVSPCEVTSEVTAGGADCTCKVLQDFQSTFFVNFDRVSQGP